MGTETTGGIGSIPQAAALFERTHWTVVLAAGQAGSPGQGAALDALCRAYWEPIYAYLRRLGQSPHDAQDVTQGFLLHLLQNDGLQNLRPEGGKFRSFLLAALKNYLADVRDRAQAIKRGGGQALLSLDHEAAESHFALEAATAPAPEHLFDRRWAATMMNRAFGRLQEEFVTTGKAAQFQEWSVFLGAEGSAGEYDAAAGRLGLTRGAVTVAVHRLRQRYRDLVRAEIAQTVTSRAELEDEMRYLLEVVCR
jgi:DNA-directed RNA polymerase specialized sigma24 family protein